MQHDIFFILLVFVISLIVASLLYRPVLHFAEKHNIYDNPNARKLQRTPIPVMGGFVTFSGALVGSLCYWFKYDCTSLIPIQIAMLIMLALGAWDDLKNISPLLRFVLEVIIVTALAFVCKCPINDFHGLWGIHEISPGVAWPLTIFACVGIINAINMIDGIDGLSSGICIMAFGFYSWLFFSAHDFIRAALGVSIIGGLIPFFIMNVFGKRSKMFIGDAGTMMLGIALCYMVMTMLTKGSSCEAFASRTNMCLIAFALAVLSIPVFDTLRVMIGRICRGESPFAPDKTHLHHAFIDYGFHHLETSLMEIMLNMMIILVFFIVEYSYLPMQWQLYGVVIASIFVCVGLYWMLGRRKRITEYYKAKKQENIPMETDDNMSAEGSESVE